MDRSCSCFYRVQSMHMHKLPLTTALYTRQWQVAQGWHLIHIITNCSFLLPARPVSWNKGRRFTSPGPDLHQLSDGANLHNYEVAAYTNIHTFNPSRVRLVVHDFDVCIINAIHYILQRMGVIMFCRR